MSRIDLDRLRQTMVAHAAREYPREACGLVVEHLGIQAYVPCRNLAPDDDHFHLDPVEHAALERRGDVLAAVHSHPDASPVLSDVDREMMEQWGMPWVVVGCPGHDVRVFYPPGQRRPLLGRLFEHGRVDCFTLIRDHFAEALGLVLPDFVREDGWWDRGQNLYLDCYASAGFVDVTGRPMQRHDVPLMRLKSPVPNHAGVFLGDDVLLHHVPGRLSRREPYSGFWATATVAVVRHESLL